MEKCVDFSAHDVDAGSMWYYYRPRRSGCTIDEADELNAKLSGWVFKMPAYKATQIDARIEGFLKPVAPAPAPGAAEPAATPPQ